jgi:Cyclic nucleotide-binding domain/FHA domain
MSNGKDSFIDFPAGTVVYKQGDTGSDMFVIESGQIDIIQTGNDEVTDSFGPGDFFGEMALLEDQPRHVTAVAKAATRALRIERAAFADVLRQNVEIAIRIMRKMSARQRRTDLRLHDALNSLSKARSAPAAAAPRAAAQAPAPAPPAPKPQPAAAAPVAPVAQNPVLRHASGQVLPLDATRNEFLVGRSDPTTGAKPDLDLGPFDSNRTLSRKHAKIVRDGALYFVRDEGGANGTFVNAERVSAGASIAIKPGDKLRFGSIEVEFGMA